ncbi:MAG: DUF3861 family protein [Alphaproteobacteria bacterium]|nr:MAG: DUF3861 family protein [Alphaproteobacteria bacterium]
MPYTYRITVENMTGAAPAGGSILNFEVSNHDDVLRVLDLVRECKIVPFEETAEFTVGLKLFGEVLIRRRQEPLFAEIYPHFQVFMKNLKKRSVPKTKVQPNPLGPQS